jgi:ABC-type Na+ efflux pump permease subunit
MVSGEMTRFSTRILVMLFIVAAAPVMALACPNCKDALAADPDSANLARGLYYSILFMLAMPMLILTGLGSLFYLEIRRAKKRQIKQQLAV